MYRKWWMKRWKTSYVDVRTSSYLACQNLMYLMLKHFAHCARIISSINHGLMNGNVGGSAKVILAGSLSHYPQNSKLQNSSRLHKNICALSHVQESSSTQTSLKPRLNRRTWSAKKRQVVAATTNPATANVTITQGISYSATPVSDNLSSNHLNPLAGPFQLRCAETRAKYETEAHCQCKCALINARSVVN